MNEISNRSFVIGLIVVIMLQFSAGLWYIDYPFVEGRFHYNWNPPFWLLRAQEVNVVGLNNTYWGLADYRSHPQLIGPVISLWTQMAGYSETSVRSIALLLTMLATVFLAIGIKVFLGARRAIAFALVFAALPIIYIYGKMFNLEALVLVFLGVHLWGIAKIDRDDMSGLALIAFGSFGMVLSDWSGLVFAGITVLAAPIVWPWREHRKRIMQFAVCSWGAAVLALQIFFLQTYLQSSASATEISIGFFEQWKYRAGFIGTFSWGEWLSQQIHFLTENFSIPLFLASVLALCGVALKKIRASDKHAWRLAIFALAIFVGELAYLSIVPQASSIHIYFQYFFAVPVAIGIVYLFDFVAEKIPAQDWRVWPALVAIAFVAIAGYAGYRYQLLLHYPSGVDVSDVQLVQGLKNIPQDKEIIAVDIENFGLSWFANPNVEYYAGRSIRGYLLSDGFPHADYIVVPKLYVDQFLSQINDKRPFGSDVSAYQNNCSSHLCILQLMKDER